MQFELKRFWNYLKEDVRRNILLMFILTSFISYFGYLIYFTSNTIGSRSKIFGAVSKQPESISTIYDFAGYILIIVGLIIISLQYGDTNTSSTKRLRLTVPVSNIEKSISLFVNLGLIMPIIGIFSLYLGFNFLGKMQTMMVLTDPTYEVPLWSFHEVVPVYFRYLALMLSFGSILIYFRRYMVFLLPIFYIVPTLYAINKTNLFKALLFPRNTSLDNLLLPTDQIGIYFMSSLIITGLILIYYVYKERELK